MVKIEGPENAGPKMADRETSDTHESQMSH